MEKKRLTSNMAVVPDAAATAWLNYRLAYERAR
jgi:hypothetical protein